MYFTDVSKGNYYYYIRMMGYLINLYMADIHIRKKEYIYALRELKKIRVNSDINSHFLYLRAMAEYGFKNYTDALGYLKKLKKLKEDYFVKSGLTLEETIRKELKEINRKIISSVKVQIKKYYAYLNDNELKKMSSLFLQKKEFKSNIKRLKLIYYGAEKVYVEPIYEKVKMGFKRNGSTVSAKIIEFSHILGNGNIPEFHVETMEFRFNLDSPPLIEEIIRGEGVKLKLKKENIKLLHRLSLWQNSIDPLYRIDEISDFWVKNTESGYLAIYLTSLYSSVGRDKDVVKLLDGKIEKLKFFPEFKYGNNFLEGKLYDTLADSYLSLGDSKKYIDNLSNGFKLSKTNGKVILKLMNYCVSNGLKREYAEYYKLLMMIAPDYPEFDKLFYPDQYAGILRCEEMIKKKEYKEAIELLTKLKQDYGTYWRISDLMGDVFYSLERYEQAIIMYEEALKYNPANGELMRKIAMSFYNEEEYYDSREYIKRALKFSQKKKIRDAAKLILKENKK
jgi:hypothetical protein